MALNQSAVNTEVVNGSVSGSVYSKSLAALSTSTALFLKGIGAIRSYAITSTTSIANFIKKTITDVEVTSSVLITVVNRLLTLIASSTSVNSINKSVSKLFSITSTSTSSIQKTFLKVLIAVKTLYGTGVLGARDRKSTRLNSSHSQQSRMPSSA